MTGISLHRLNLAAIQLEFAVLLCGQKLLAPCVANMILYGIYTISKFTCAICSRLGAFSFGNSIYVSVEEKFALQPSTFQCKCKRKIYVIFENRVKNGEEIASYNGGESCLAAK